LVPTIFSRLFSRLCQESLLFPSLPHASFPLFLFFLFFGLVGSPAESFFPTVSPLVCLFKLSNFPLGWLISRIYLGITDFVATILSLDTRTCTEFFPSLRCFFFLSLLGPRRRRCLAPDASLCFLTCSPSTDLDFLLTAFFPPPNSSPFSESSA